MKAQTNKTQSALPTANFGVVDLTHTLNANIPRFGTEPPVFEYAAVCSIDEQGCFAGVFRCAEHYGTHIDAPAHFVKGASTIDKLDPSKLVLPAVVIDARAESEADADYALTLEKVKEFEKEGEIAAGSAVLLMTGWDKHFSAAQKYRNADHNGKMHFPGYSLAAARYLVETRSVAALGVDTLSIDVGCSDNYEVHASLLASAYFIENLTNLDKLPARGALLFCGALPIEGGSGCPARILAICPWAPHPVDKLTLGGDYGRSRRLSGSRHRR